MVATNKKLAGRTPQAKRLEAAIETLRGPLSTAVRKVFYYSEAKPEQLEGLTVTLTRVAKDLLPALKVTFEEKQLQEAAKHYMTRLRNFTKIVTELTRPTSWAEMEEVIKDNSTKSKTIYTKYNEYAEEVLYFVTYFDREKETNLSIAGWEVVVWENPNREWDADLYERLRYILEQATRILKAKGFGKYAGGRLHAYPTEVLPTRRSALASYLISQDVMDVAVQGNADRVVANMVHETGHRVYFKALSGNARSEWEDFFDANQGVPDVDTLIALWEQYSTSEEVKTGYSDGRLTGNFYRYLKQKDPAKAMWLQVVSYKLPKLEVLDQYTGSLKKGAKTGLDLLIENRSTIKTFLYPVTAYSSTNAQELYAETFMAYLTEGPQRVPEVVRVMFQRVTPMLKTAHSQKVASTNGEQKMAYTYNRTKLSWDPYLPEFKFRKQDQAPDWDEKAVEKNLESVVRSTLKVGQTHQIEADEGVFPLTVISLDVRQISADVDESSIEEDRYGATFNWEGSWQCKVSMVCKTLPSGTAITDVYDGYNIAYFLTKRDKEVKFDNFVAEYSLLDFMEPRGEGFAEWKFSQRGDQTLIHLTFNILASTKASVGFE